MCDSGAQVLHRHRVFLPGNQKGKPDLGEAIRGWKLSQGTQGPALLLADKGVSFSACCLGPRSAGHLVNGWLRVGLGDCGWRCDCRVLKSITFSAEVRGHAPASRQHSSSEPEVGHYWEVP